MTGKPLVLIISPARANANNGNWQTAARWSSFLEKDYQACVQQDWDGQQQADLMIALHARRSAPAIHAWAARCPGKPLVVVLTGTDLYRDIRHDQDARRSLDMAQRLVVLQDAGLDELPPALRAKTVVIRQSAPPWTGTPIEKDAPFRVMMVGHLRPEKMPVTYMQAARLLAPNGLQMLHVGGALDEDLGRLARHTQNDCPHYRWLGALPHQEARALLAGSDLMVISSAMEGGAHVVIEAMVSDVPVLASDIPGNRGMLGADYGGYFPLGDAAALAVLLDRARHDTAWLAGLAEQCRARAPLFSPAAERAALFDLLDNALSRN